MAMSKCLRLSIVVAWLGSTLACVHPSTTPHSLDYGQAEAPQLPPRFELLCWNTHKQRHPGFEAELGEFAAGVELLLLQEAVDPAPVWTRLPTARAWTMVAAFGLGRDEVQTGVATGSTAAPLRDEALLSPRTEPLVRTHKSALLSWIGVEGAEQPLLVINLHGLNFRPAPALDEQLQALDPTLRAHAGPVLVAGDFNTWSCRRHQIVDGFIARHGLRSVFVGEDAPRLDGVYVRGLKVRAAQVLDSRSSDHPALRVELELLE